MPTGAFRSEIGPSYEEGEPRSFHFVSFRQRDKTPLKMTEFGAILIFAEVSTCCPGARSASSA